MISRYPNRAGFTLIELLLAVSLMLILVVAVVTVFNQTSQVFSISEAKMELFQNVRIGMDQISREIASANNSRKVFELNNLTAAVVQQAEAATSPGNDVVIRLLTFDTTTSWVDSNSGSPVSHENEKAKIQYTLVKKKQANDKHNRKARWRLFRQVFTANVTTPDDATKDVVETQRELLAGFINPDPATGLPNLRLEFARFESGNWKYVEPTNAGDAKDPNPKKFTEDNDNNKMPHAIRITAEFAPKERNVFRTISRNFWIAGAQ